MAQFDVYENKDAQSRKRTPYLMDIQSNILETLATGVVVPLRPYEQDEDAVISKLHPLINIGNNKYAAVVTEMAGIRRSLLGAPAFSAAGERQKIIDACDLILTGF